MRSDRGNAVVEFVAVVPLLLIVGLAVVQVALLAHTRSVVQAAATDAARTAATSAQPQQAARNVAEDVLRAGLGDVPISSLTTTTGAVSGMPVVSVHLEARPDLFMLPDAVVVSATRHALMEAVR